MRPAERDDDLVARIRAGDAAAFERLFTAQYEGLTRYAYALLGDLDAARDVVCDIFTGLWSSPARTTWAPAGGPRMYLLTAVRNRCFNTARDTRRHAALIEARHPADLPLPRDLGIPVDDNLDHEARWPLVTAAIEAMPPLRREAMRLRWIDGLSHAEVAAVMGISINAVYLHLSAALRDLKGRFGG